MIALGSCVAPRQSIWQRKPTHIFEEGKRTLHELRQVFPQPLWNSTVPGKLQFLLEPPGNLDILACHESDKARFYLPHTNVHAPLLESSTDDWTIARATISGVLVSSPAAFHFSVIPVVI